MLSRDPMSSDALSASSKNGHGKAIANTNELMTRDRLWSHVGVGQPTLVSSQNQIHSVSASSALDTTGASRTRPQFLKHSTTLFCFLYSAVLHRTETLVLQACFFPTKPILTNLSHTRWRSNIHETTSVSKCRVWDGMISPFFSWILLLHMFIVHDILLFLFLASWKQLNTKF